MIGLLNLFLGAALALQPFYAGTDCPQGYDALNGYCFLKGTRFGLSGKTALTTSYIKEGQDLIPITAHYVVLSVYATLPGAQKAMPVPGLPIEILPVERDQTVYQFAASGDYAAKKIPAYARHAIPANINGQVAFSIRIEKDEDVEAQKFLVRSEFMGKDDWRSFRADRAAFEELATVNEKTLLGLKEMPQDVAVSTAKGIRDLALAFQPRVRGEHVEESGLEKRDSTSDLLDQDWEKIKAEIIKTIKIVKDAGGQVVKAVIETGKRVLELVIKTVRLATKVLVQFLKIVGLGLLTVIDAIKFVFRWDEVLNTQIVLNNFTYYVRDNSEALFDQKREQVLAYLAAAKTSLTAQINFLIQRIKGEQPELKQLDGAKSSIPKFSFVLDAITTNANKLSIYAPANAKQTIEQQLVKIEKSGFKDQRLASALTQVRKDLTLKDVGVEIVTALLVLIRGIFEIINSVVSVGADVAIRLFSASVSLYWIIASYEVKIPFVSDLYKHVISNNRYELSLLHLTTLPPAIVYTYAYMLTHSGKAPFPGTPVAPPVGNSTVPQLPAVPVTPPTQGSSQQQNGSPFEQGQVEQGSQSTQEQSPVQQDQTQQSPVQQGQSPNQSAQQDKPAQFQSGFRARLTGKTESNDWRADLGFDPQPVNGGLDVNKALKQDTPQQSPVQHDALTQQQQQTPVQQEQSPVQQETPAQQGQHNVWNWSDVKRKSEIDAFEKELAIYQENKDVEPVRVNSLFRRSLGSSIVISSIVAIIMFVAFTEVLFFLYLGLIALFASLPFAFFFILFFIFASLYTPLNLK